MPTMPFSPVRTDFPKEAHFDPDLAATSGSGLLRFCNTGKISVNLTHSLP